MIGTGLAVASPQQAQALPPPPSPNLNVGNVMNVQSLASIQAQARLAAQALDKQQSLPEIVGLAAHIKGFWEQAKHAKLQVEADMLEALYARRGKYTSIKEAQIAAAGQPLIYMMLAASKMRQVEALLRDTLVGAGTEKPWTLEPEPDPDLPLDEVAQIKELVTQEVTDAISAGLDPTPDAVRDRLIAAKEELVQRLRESARVHTTRMEDKMETQLDEGGFPECLDGFITDLATFKTAFVMGPITRNKPKLTWVQGNPVPVVTTTATLEWERGDPFDMYPAPWAKSLYDAPFIRKHKLTRKALTEMKGLGADSGYSDAAIDRVLDLYGLGGLREWLQVDTQLAVAEGKTTLASVVNTSLIDALQFWGSVSGALLQQWGMDAKQCPDKSKEYEVEAWLIGPYVIKAVLNADPLARRPYYADSYEVIPGSVWGNSPYDLMHDCQDMCNGAARALAANLGISSGPQVVVNVSRVPTGEVISQMYPWKIWQVTSDPMGSTAKPVDFFQPSSNAAELMGVYEKFSALADDYVGVPKYMTGEEGTPGAGRTASGLSMMIGNASKLIKNVIGSVDTRILTPLLERLYYYNMRFSQDPDLKGPCNIVARGAMSLTTKEAAQVRRNEFLQATNNPTDMQIIGLEGRAEVLRTAASGLDMNVDRIVPSTAVLKEKQKAIQNAQAAAAAEAQQQPGQGLPGVPPGPPPPGGPTPNGQPLMNGAPATDHFQPAAQPAPQGATP